MSANKISALGKTINFIMYYLISKELKPYNLFHWILATNLLSFFDKATNVVFKMSYILVSESYLTHCQANMITMILSPCDILNGLRTGEHIDLGLMLFVTDNQREMEEGWDFTWLGTGMTVSESSVHSVIQKAFWYAGELVYIYEKSKWHHTLTDP